MNRLFKSEKGASSIMVILLLVVLVVFGVAALTTALSNVRLGQKVEDWNEKYYAAEAQANEVYAKVDSAVIDGAILQLASSKWPPPPDKIPEYVNDLNFDIETAETAQGYDFSYEVWQEDVGIRVTLAYNRKTMALSPTQWKEVQKEIH